MARCNPKTLRGIFGTARKLGLSHEDLRELTTTGRLSRISEREATGLLVKLQETQRGGKNKQGSRPWRLYSSSTLAREIRFYRDGINWRAGREAGFQAWLKQYFNLERLEWVDSFKKAVAIKNALKRMQHEEAGKCKPSCSSC